MYFIILDSKVHGHIMMNIRLGSFNDSSRVNIETRDKIIAIK